MTEAEQIEQLLADKPYTEFLKRLCCHNRKQVTHLQLEYETGYLGLAEAQKLVSWAEEIVLQMSKVEAEFGSSPSAQLSYEGDDPRAIIATIYRWQTDAEYLLSLQRMHGSYVEKSRLAALLKQASLGDLDKLRAEAERLGLKLVPKDQA